MGVPREAEPEAEAVVAPAPPAGALTGLARGLPALSLSPPRAAASRFCQNTQASISDHLNRPRTTHAEGTSDSDAHLHGSLGGRGALRLALHLVLEHVRLRAQRSPVRAIVTRKTPLRSLAKSRHKQRSMPHGRVHTREQSESGHARPHQAQVVRQAASAE